MGSIKNDYLNKEKINHITTTYRKLELRLIRFFDYFKQKPIQRYN